MRVFFKPIKKKKQRRKFRFRLFMFLPLLKRCIPVVIFLLAVWGIVLLARMMLFTSDVFRVTQIELSGENLPQLAREAGFYGLSSETNIFGVDARAISRRVMEENRQFKKVLITKKLPNTLSVEIHYHEPAILVRRPTGFWHDRRAEVEYFPVGKSGVILPKALSRGRDLPVLLGLDLYNRNLKPGDRIRSPQLYAALSVLEDIKLRWPFDKLQIKGLDASDTRNISVTVNADVRIIIGRKEGMEEKLKKLKRFLEKRELELEKLKYIDLRFEKIVLGPR